MKTVVAAALGECVHVAGVSNFLRLAEAAGWRTVFLGPAVPIEQVLEAARQEKADLVGVSYRLTPETGERLLGEFAEAAASCTMPGVRFAFGGTPPVAERARALGFFEQIFDGSEPPEGAGISERSAVLASSENDFPQTTIERIHWKVSFPADPPSLRLAHHGSHPGGHRTNRRGPSAGCDFAGNRPGCPGELLPPRAPGSTPHGSRRRAGTFCRGLPAPVSPPAGRAIIP